MPKTIAGLVAAALLLVAACGDDGEEATVSDEAWELPGEFCADTEVIRDRYDESTELDSDTADAAFANFADAIARVTPADEIADDWAILAGLYDEEAADDAIDQEAVMEAAANVDAYLREECDITFDVAE